MQKYRKKKSKKIQYHKKFKKINKRRTKIKKGGSKNLKLWNIELENRLKNNNPKIYNDYCLNLGNYYRKLNNLFKFIYENQLPLFMDQGALLMTVRHNGFMETGNSFWDEDIDYAMLYEDVEKVLEVFKNSPFRFEIRHDGSFYNRLMNPSCKDHNVTIDLIKDRNTVLYKYPFLKNKQFSYFEIKDHNNELLLSGDLMFHNRDKIIKIYPIFTTEKQICNRLRVIEFNYNDIFPLKYEKFYDSKVYIPNNYENVLNIYYSNIHGNPLDVIATKKWIPELQNWMFDKDYYMITNKKAPAVKII
jgi:phosphorylcholine metabolism protein LicD